MDQKMEQFRTFSPLHREYLYSVFTSILRYYGKNLTAFAVFGSYARRENRKNSDLDLLMILKHTTRRSERIREFIDAIEMKNESLAQRLYESDGIMCELSPLILSETESRSFHPVYSDMAEHCIVLYDPTELLQKILLSAKALLTETSARKVRRNNTWEWQFSRFLGGVKLLK
mgnify:CR=1 FL=1